MRIMSLNVNGIRAAHRKGLFDWLPKQGADVICLQEVRALQEQLPAEALSPPGYRAYFHPAEKKGYSGVAIYTRKEPLEIKMGLGWPDMDSEGRYLRIDFERLSVISLYLPSGTSGDERQAIKYDFMRRFLPVLEAMRADQREYIICGDWNIAHRQIDLKNRRSNQKNSGFLPDERAWLDQVFDEVGLVDAFRQVNQEPEQYTWWSNRGQSWAKNVGWRIDYQVVTPGLKSKIKSADIYKGARYSDHAPLSIDYDMKP